MASCGEGGAGCATGGVENSRDHPKTKQNVARPAETSTKPHFSTRSATRVAETSTTTKQNQTKRSETCRDQPKTSQNNTKPSETRRELSKTRQSNTKRSESQFQFRFTIYVVCKSKGGAHEHRERILCGGDWQHQLRCSGKVSRADRRGQVPWSSTICLVKVENLPPPKVIN